MWRASSAAAARLEGRNREGGREGERAARAGAGQPRELGHGHVQLRRRGRSQQPAANKGCANKKHENKRAKARERRVRRPSWMDFLSSVQPNLPFRMGLLYLTRDAIENARDGDMPSCLVSDQKKYASSEGRGLLRGGRRSVTRAVARAASRDGRTCAVIVDASRDRRVTSYPLSPLSRSRAF